MIDGLANIVLMEIADADDKPNGMNRLDAIRLLLSAVAKLIDLVDEKS
jgi:hypothetical protein